MVNTWPGNQPEDYQKLSATNMGILDMWVKNRLMPVRTAPRRGMMSSYELKHIMERENGLYVTNGQFKGAMQQAGFKAYNTSDINWLYRVRVV